MVCICFNFYYTFNFLLVMLASTGYRSAGETRNKLIKNLNRYRVDSKLNKSYTQGYLVKKVPGYWGYISLMLHVCMSINLYNTHVHTYMTCTCMYTVSTQNVVHIV
mgnify:CR=1 FL=1